jgi:hypothetical protein
LLIFATMSLIFSRSPGALSYTMIQRSSEFL